MTIKRQRSAAQLISSLTIPVMVVNSFAPKVQHLPSNPAAKPVSMPRSTTCISFSTKEQESGVSIPSFQTAVSCPSFPELFDSDVASTASTVISNDSSIATAEIVEIGEFSSSLSLQTPTQRGKSLIEHLNVNMSSALGSRPRIVGHRGSLYQSLENTRHSIRLAANHCEEVEIDVFLLKCGTLIVFHGGGTDQNPGCLKDYCNVNKSILDLTYEEARKLKFSPHYAEFGCGPDIIRKFESECYIPTLEEVLSDARETGVVIKVELKGPGTPEPVLKLVEKMNMVEQVHYSSFDHSRIKRIRELRPDLNLDGSHRYKTGALFDEVPDNFVELALDAGATEVHLKYSTCTKDRVEKIHAAGLDSMIWMRGPIGMKHDTTHLFNDVGNEDESMYMAIMATGVKAMCVNRPDVLASALSRNAKSCLSM